MGEQTLLPGPSAPSNMDFKQQKRNNVFQEHVANLHTGSGEQLETTAYDSFGFDRLLSKTN